MNKELVEVFVPALDHTFDIYIPLDLPMYSVLGLMRKAIEELSDKRFITDRNTVICHREDGMILDINLSAYELGIHNGSKLMLI